MDGGFMTTPTTLRTELEALVLNWIEYSGVEMNVDQKHALLFGVVPEQVEVVTRKLAEAEKAARIDELEKLRFHGQGSDKQTVQKLYTHKLLRLAELKAGKGGEV